MEVPQGGEHRRPPFCVWRFLVRSLRAVEAGWAAARGLAAVVTAFVLGTDSFQVLGKILA